MYLHPEKINSAQPLPYPGLPEREELRKRSLDVMRRVVLNDLQQGVPALSEAFAQFCADRFDNELRYLLCISSVTQAKGALAMTNKWLAEHVEKCRPLFVEEEIERRILAEKFVGLGLQQ